LGVGERNGKAQHLEGGRHGFLVGMTA
jgi:hypothetical protein